MALLLLLPRLLLARHTATVVATATSTTAYTRPLPPLPQQRHLFSRGGAETSHVHSTRLQLTYRQKAPLATATISLPIDHRRQQEVHIQNSFIATGARSGTGPLSVVSVEAGSIESSHEVINRRHCQNHSWPGRRHYCYYPVCYCCYCVLLHYFCYYGCCCYNCSSSCL